MNNIVEYFYKIKPQNMIKIGVNYRFEYNNEIYYFEIYNQNSDIEKNISKFMTIKRYLVVITE